jgi:hypothetical protein
MKKKWITPGGTHSKLEPGISGINSNTLRFSAFHGTKNSSQRLGGFWIWPYWSIIVWEIMKLITDSALTRYLSSTRVSKGCSNVFSRHFPKVYTCMTSDCRIHCWVWACAYRPTSVLVLDKGDEARLKPQEHVAWHSSRCIGTYLSFYGSIALCWNLASFSVSCSSTQSVGLLGRGISGSQGRCLHKQDNTNTE